jgi:hypothetical protein
MASRSKDSNRPTGGTVAEPTSAQGQVSERENRLAEGLQSAGLLSPLLSALIEQREPRGGGTGEDLRQLNQRTGGVVRSSRSPGSQPGSFRRRSVRASVDNVGDKPATQYYLPKKVKAEDQKLGVPTPTVDEPTAVVAGPMSGGLFATRRRFRSRGSIAVLFPLRNNPWKFTRLDCILGSVRE